MPVGSAAIGTKTAEPYRYTMADLEAQTGLPGRTIRYYITQGLLPAARGRGVGATYGPTHLLRLKAIGQQAHDARVEVFDHKGKPSRRGRGAAAAAPRDYFRV